LNAQDLAKYGYVFIPINYHLGDTSGLFIGYTQWPPNFQPSATALQNMKEAQADAESAILWVRAHAAQYRLDPNKVVLMGTSAGAFTALYTGHLTTSRIHPPNVVVSVMGAILPLDLPRITAKGPPTIFFHGTADITMPFLSARLTYERLRSVGTATQWHEFAGVAHSINIEGSLTKPFLLPFLVSQLQLNTTPTHTPAPTPTPIPGDYTDAGDVPGDQVNIFDYNYILGYLRINPNTPYTIFDYSNVVTNFGL
jgi:predicted esterase